MELDKTRSGIITKRKGETVILLPPGSIRKTIQGSSGEIYHSVLVDAPELGRPTDVLLHGEQIIFIDQRND